MNQKKTLLQAMLLLVVLMATVVSCYGGSFKGEVAKPVEAAPQIDLSDQNGAAFQLSDLQGKVVLVFFGFTNCVDECPLTMAHLKQALEMLGNEAANVQVVMVTTDPVRDTPKALGNFLSKFNPTFIGLTGSMDQLTGIWADYGITVLQGGETHSSYTYAIDQEGNLRLYLNPEMSPEDIASDLRVLLTEG